MRIIEVIQRFEDDMGVPETMHFSNGDSHIKIEFEDNGDYKDVFVYEIEEIVVDRTLEVDNVIYSPGDRLLIEIHHETPTVYGHELSFVDLIKHIESNYKQIDEGVDFISNFDDRWNSLEKFIEEKSYDW